MSVRSPMHVGMSAILLLAALLPLAACSQTALPEERVRAYWDAVKLADWRTAWEMERKAQTKEEHPSDYYRRQQGQLRIAGVKFGQPRILGATAELDLSLERILPFANGRYRRPETMQDRWVFADGAWWHLEAVYPRPQSEGQAPSGEPASGSEGKADQLPTAGPEAQAPAAEVQAVPAQPPGQHP